MNSRMAVRWAKGTSWREVISTPKDDRQVGGWANEMIDYLQNDDRMFCRILFQQVFEIRGAGAQNHLVGLGVLALIISYNMRCNMRREIEATSVAMVTSQKLFSSLRCLKEATMLVWKSFQRRQNCWSSVIFGKRLCSSAIDADIYTLGGMNKEHQICTFKSQIFLPLIA